MHKWLDNVSHNNALGKLPPEHKLGFALIVLIISLIAYPTVHIIIALWMSIWILIYGKISFKIYSKLLILAITFLLTSIPALLISVITISAKSNIYNDVILGFNLGNYYLYLSHEGLRQTTLIFSRTLATVSCFYFILLTTPFTEILKVLRNIGFPIILTELLLLMYRFILILLTTAQEIWIAQKSRNGYKNKKRWLYSLSLLISQLFHKTFEYYRQFLLSTKSRGFNGEFRVYSSRNYQPSLRYLIEAIVGCIILVILNIKL